MIEIRKGFMITRDLVHELAPLNSSAIIFYHARRMNAVQKKDEYITCNERRWSFIFKGDNMTVNINWS